MHNHNNGGGGVNNSLVQDDDNDYYVHNTHHECSTCSAVPFPYNPAMLCPRFRVSRTNKKSSTAGAVGLSSIAGPGDSVGATFGGSDYASVQQQQSLSQHQQFARSVPKQTTTTFAAQQSMAKLKGSLADDGTVSTPSFPEAEKENVTSTRSQNSNSVVARGLDPQYQYEMTTSRTRLPPSSSAVTAASIPSRHSSKNRGSGVNCVMDAFETLMNGGQSSFNAAFPEMEQREQPRQIQQQQHLQHPDQLPSMMETTNSDHHYSSGKRHNNSRYQQLPDNGKSNKGNRFLSLRRNRSRDCGDEEATEPMMRNHQNRYSMPSDEEGIIRDYDGNDRRNYKTPPHEQQAQYHHSKRSYGQEEAAAVQNSSRGSRMRRIQKRFLA
ncbi:MAG: hypothetical protein SGILL_010296 [Bacillariaceae sp.]